MKKIFLLMLLALSPLAMSAQNADDSKVAIIEGGAVDTLVLTLDHANTAKKHKYVGKNQQFELADADGLWHTAQVTFVDDSTVKLWSSEVQHPSQARYAWSESTVAAIQKAYGLCSLPFTANVVRKNKPTIFSIGDSTMANKGEGTEECGWGQVLGEFFTDGIVVDNHAQNGRSSKSFIDEGRWQKVLDLIKPGDYVFIQWGHNDEKPDEKRHTDANTSFKDNLRRYITEAQAKGARPVLFNSMVRRKFDESGHLTNTHGEYIKAPFEVAEEMGVPYVDAESLSKALVESYGPEDSKKLYMWFPPKKQDDTHLNHFGARTMAKLFLDATVEVVPSLKQYLK